MSTKKFLTKVIFGAVINLFAVQAYATPNCPKGHCANISEKMNRFCIDNGMAGKLFLVFGPDGGECLCPCSCVATDTKISLFDEIAEAIRIDELKMGESLKSPLSKKMDNKVGKLLASDFSERAGKVHYMKFSNSEELVVSADHSFVTPNMKVRAAEELHEGSVILDENMKEVTVLENSIDSNFNGKLMNVIINENSPKAKNHFVVTNSILSGDWLLQSNYASFKNDIDARLGRVETFNAR
jgi:hypothetical protein